MNFKKLSKITDNFAKYHISDADLSAEEKQEILDFIKSNYVDYDTEKPLQESKLSLNGRLVSYNGNVQLKEEAKTITNNSFEWGKVRDFIVEKSKIKNLIGSPKEVLGIYSCSKCSNLTSLSGAPEKAAMFYCQNCTSLTSLEGGPLQVNLFDCSGCTSLKNLTGAPKEVKSDFHCTKCGVKFTEDIVKKVSDVKGKIFT